MNNTIKTRTFSAENEKEISGEESRLPLNPEIENSYDWQKKNDRPRKIMFAGDDVPFAWSNPLNIKSKRYSAIRKALREINNPKN